MEALTEAFKPTYVAAGFGAIIVLILISAFIFKWILEITKILDNLKNINKNIEENNELLKELIDDLNSKKERQADQQKLEF
jgi:membrane protein insertase Oxa1/YidC/SpoIIIJ